MTRGEIDRPMQNAWSAIVDLAIIAAIVVLAVRREYGALAILASIAGARFGISAGKTIERVGRWNPPSLPPPGPPPWDRDRDPREPRDPRPPTGGRFFRIALAVLFAVVVSIVAIVPRALGR